MSVCGGRGGGHVWDVVGRRRRRRREEDSKWPQLRRTFTETYVCIPLLGGFTAATTSADAAAATREAAGGEDSRVAMGVRASLSSRSLRRRVLACPVVCCVRRGDDGWAASLMQACMHGTGVVVYPHIT